MDYYFFTVPSFYENSPVVQPLLTKSRFSAMLVCSQMTVYVFVNVVHINNPMVGG